MSRLPLPGRTRLATYGQIVLISVGLFVLGILGAIAFGEEPPSTPDASDLPATVEPATP